MLPDWHRRLRDFFWIFFLPCAWIWAGLAKLRRRKHKRKRTGQPFVLSVGNVHVGGSGKTPVTQAIAKRFAEKTALAILSRGYQSPAEKTNQQVDLNRADGAAFFGDEPWLLAQSLNVPVFVGRDRKRSLQAAQVAGAKFILADDCFQHHPLERNFDLVVINSRNRVDDAFCLPLGTLREPLSALKFADAIFLIGSKDENAAWIRLLSENFQNVKYFVLKKKVVGVFEGEVPYAVTGDEFWGAFSGIADPARFHEDLATIGRVKVLGEYRDHHRFTEADAQHLISKQKTHGTTHFICTEKDFGKAQAVFSRLQARLFTLRIEYEIPNEFWYFLETYLEKN